MRPVLFLPLVILGLALAIFNWRLSRPVQNPETVVAVSALPQAQVDEVFDQGQYFIVWSNPRYETDLKLQPHAFTVDVNVVNKSLPEPFQMIVNCDRDDVSGLGVNFDHDGAVILPLETGTKVVVCRYTPTGAYDPNLAVEIHF